MRILKKIFRFIPIFNKIENEFLDDEFKQKVIELKEQKSQELFNVHYCAIAQENLLQTTGILYEVENNLVHNHAMNLFFDDLHNQKLDEFYNFI